MRRKLIQQGNNSYTLTLPVKWIRDNNLDKEGEIDVSEEDNKLVISGAGKAKAKEIDISMKYAHKIGIMMVLNQLYRNGYGRITIRDVNKEQMKEIEKHAETRMNGIEISSISEDKCVLEVISEPRDDNYQVLLRKMFFMIQDSLAIMGEDKEKISAYLNKAKMHEQFCKRYIANNIKTQEGYEHYSMLSYMIVIQSDCRYMARSLKGKVPKDMEKELVKLQEIVKESSDNFFKKDVKGLDASGKKAFELFESSVSQIEKKKEKKAYHFLCEICRLLYSMHSPMIGVTVSYGNEEK